MKNFSVATFNVHSWCDANFSGNYDRVKKLVKEHDPDFLCLQETISSKETYTDLGYPYFHDFRSCAILSKVPIQLYEQSKKSRFLTVKIDLEENCPLFLTCMHLDFRTEPGRLIEIKAIRKHLEPVFKENHFQIWTGDFNAITREDYNNEKWNHITGVRKHNGWELPKTELTTQVKEFGFRDSWQQVGCPEPIKTCRFDTHIDYVYANNQMLSKYKVENVIHVDDPASDHNLVKATFVKK